MSNSSSGSNSKESLSRTTTWAHWLNTTPRSLKGLSLTRWVICNNYMYLNSGIRPVDRKTNHNKYMYMYFNSTGLMCKNCIAIKLPSPVHLFALLCPPVVCWAPSGWYSDGPQPWSRAFRWSCRYRYWGQPYRRHGPSPWALHQWIQLHCHVLFLPVIKWE